MMKRGWNLMNIWKKRDKGSLLPKAIGVTASAAPLLLVAPLIAPIAVEAVGEQGAAVTVTQSLDEVVSARITSELGGSLLVGDSITVDLDEVFEDDAADLLLSAINHNPDVASISLLSGDLHIQGKNTGSTYIELTAKRDPYGPAVHERVELQVVSGLVDAHSDGITIDDITRYMQEHSERTFGRANLNILLEQISPQLPLENSAPVSTSDALTLEIMQWEPNELDLRSLFYDADGDSLTYQVTQISGSFIETELHSGSILSMSTSEGVGSSFILNVTASDNRSQTTATKEIYASVVPSQGPEGTYGQYVIMGNGQAGFSSFIDVSSHMTDPRDLAITGYGLIYLPNFATNAFTVNPDVMQGEVPVLAESPLFTISADQSGYAYLFVVAQNERGAFTTTRPGFLELLFADTEAEVNAGGTLVIPLPYTPDEGTQPQYQLEVFSNDVMDSLDGLWSLFAGLFGGEGEEYEEGEYNFVKKLGEVTIVDNAIHIEGPADYISEQPALVQVDYTMTVDDEIVSGRWSVLVHITQN